MAMLNNRAILKQDMLRNQFAASDSSQPQFSAYSEPSAVIALSRSSLPGDPEDSRSSGTYTMNNLKRGPSQVSATRFNWLSFLTPLSMSIGIVIIVVSETRQSGIFMCAVIYRCLSHHDLYLFIAVITPVESTETCLCWKSNITREQAISLFSGTSHWQFLIKLFFSVAGVARGDLRFQWKCTAKPEERALLINICNSGVFLRSWLHPWLQRNNKW
jgi:hypothetical protein